MFDAFSVTEWASTYEASDSHFDKVVLASTGDPFKFGSFRWELFAGLAGKQKKNKQSKSFII